jgi:hypothetical protein
LIEGKFYFGICNLSLNYFNKKAILKFHELKCKGVFVLKMYKTRFKKIQLPTANKNKLQKNKQLKKYKSSSMYSSKLNESLFNNLSFQIKKSNICN